MVRTTPTVKLCITSYYASILEGQQHKPKVGERNNLKICLEGEVLTTNEFLENELIEEGKMLRTKAKSKREEKV